MKTLRHIQEILLLLWTLPVRHNEMARRLRILERRLDWYTANSNRKVRRKLDRMLYNKKSAFHFSKPRSPIHIG